MKYMGSKSRIVKQIVPIIQSYIDTCGSSTYIEPFVGGANVIDKIRCDHKYGYDKNKYLISLLDYVKNGGELLPSVSRELYTEIRNHQNDNTYPDWMVGNVGILASYNGRWFDGGYAAPGYEKTKNGDRYRDYYQESKTNLENQSKKLSDIVFECADFFNLNCNNYTNCVIYCDPPYLNSKQYQNAKSFNYDEYYNKLRELGRNNIVICSEQYMPDDFKCIWQQSVSRSIKATDKTYAVEKLFITTQN